MLVEEPIVVNVRKKHDYTVNSVEVHIGTETDLVLCDKDMTGLESGRRYGVKEDEVCAACVALSLAESIELAALAKRLEEVVADLRRDGQSLFAHGNVPSATGHVSKAAAALMDEARHRALGERLSGTGPRRTDVEGPA